MTLGKLWSNGPVVRAFASIRVPGSKLLGGSKVDLVFQPSEVDQMSKYEFLGT